MEEVGKEEANELEGKRDESIPDKREEGSNGKTFVVNFVSVKTGREDCSGVPVGRGCVCCSLFVRLEEFRVSTVVHLPVK